MGVSLQEQPGWTAISAAGVHVLVRWDDATPGLARLRDAASSGDLDEVLDALAREGVRQAPDFAAVQEGSPFRVVARGTAYAVVSAAAGETELRAAARGPWSDHDAPDAATSVQLRTGEELPEAEPEREELPGPEVEAEAVVEPEPEALVDPEPRPVPAQPASPAAASAPSGWRLPTRLGRGRASSEPEPDSPAVPAPAAEEVDELPSYDHLFGATQHGRPDPTVAHYIEPHDTDSISEPGIGRAPIEAAGGFTPAPAQQSDLTLPPPADTERAAPRRAEPVPPRQERAPATPTAAAAPAPVAPPAPGGLIDSVPWRSGGSNVAPPDAAADTSAAPAPAAPPVRPAGVHTPPPAPSLRPVGTPEREPSSPPEPPAQPEPAAQPQPAPRVLSQPAPRVLSQPTPAVPTQPASAPQPQPAPAVPAPAAAPTPTGAPAPSSPPAPQRPDPWSAAPASAPAGQGVRRRRRRGHGRPQRPAGRSPGRVRTAGAGRAVPGRPPQPSARRDLPVLRA